MYLTTRLVMLPHLADVNVVVTAQHRTHSIYVQYWHNTHNRYTQIHANAHMHTHTHTRMRTHQLHHVNGELYVCEFLDASDFGVGGSVDVDALTDAVQNQKCGTGSYAQMKEAAVGIMEQKISLSIKVRACK